jgi:uncharacterized protein (TIGR00369 family)
MSPAEIEAIVHRGVPLAAAWGVRVLRAEGGEAEVELPANPTLLRPGGTLSGPALMGLADVAMWAALLGISEGRDESLTATMNIAFLRPAGAGPVVAHARLLKPTGRTRYGEVFIRRAGAEEIAVHVTTSWTSLTPPAAR